MVRPGIKLCDICRSKETGKSRGFAFLAYEDQRSTNLAVDNLNGARIGGRTVTVDHVDNYKRMLVNLFMCFESRHVNSCLCKPGALMSACNLQYLNFKEDLLLVFVVPEARWHAYYHQQKILDIEGLEGESPAEVGALQKKLNALKKRVKQWLVFLPSLSLVAR